MRFLERGLRGFGYETASISLPATFGSMEDCLESMRRQWRDLLPDGRKAAFVAHSLGGLVVRLFLERDKPSNVHACVFIATPHEGSKIADIACRIPIFSDVFPTVRDMTTHGDRRPVRHASDMKLGVIAGTANRSILGRLLLKSQSDGRVELASAKAADAHDTLLLPWGHHQILFRQPTLMAVDSFLKRGTFSRD